MTIERAKYLDEYCISKKCKIYERNDQCAKCNNCMYEKGRADAEKEHEDDIKAIEDKAKAEAIDECIDVIKNVISSATLIAILQKLKEKSENEN